jgi:DNA-binding beta-propeller fold protein YncE
MRMAKIRRHVAPRGRWSQNVGLLAWLAAAMVAMPAAALCPGDCNGDGVVAVNELIRSVNIALGSSALPICPPADRDGSGTVDINELTGAVAVSLEGCPATVQVYRSPETVAPSRTEGVTRGVLPNGRIVEPAGRQVPLETLPLNLAFVPGEQYLIVSNDGYRDEDGEQYVQVVDTSTLSLTKTPTGTGEFLGLALTPDGSRAFVAQDTDDGPVVLSLHLTGNTAVVDPQPLAQLPRGSFPTGMTISPDGHHLYVLGMVSNALYSIDLDTGTLHEAGAAVGNYPYGVILSGDGTRAYVSVWGMNNGVSTTPDPVPAPLPPLLPNDNARSAVAVVDLTNPDSPALQQYIPIARSFAVDNVNIMGGTHPSAMRLSPDGKLLYVTATNVDLLVAVDTTTLQTVAEIPLNLFESGPLLTQLQGLYPNSIAVTPDGRRLYIADAGINAVQIIDADPDARQFTPAGFIPAGWYPTAVLLSGDGKRLYVANGKATGLGPNGGPEFDKLGLTSDSIHQLLKGSLSVIDGVDTYDGAAGQQLVRARSGFDPVEVRWTDGQPDSGQVTRGNPVPIDFGSAPSDLIRYVVFILKENRTYDHLFGSFTGANGDPDLEMYGEAITPNAHALARQFAMGDNFFNDGDVSTSGHEWADQGNCSDWTEKLWPPNYDRTLPSSVLEQGQDQFTKNGFFFQALERQGVPYRVYGETLALLSRFAAGDSGKGVSSLLPPLLQAFKGVPTEDQIFEIANGNIEALRDQGVDTDLIRTALFPNQNLDFPSNILASFTDVQRAQIFQNELQTFNASGQFPRFVHIWLPTDHTFGGDPGSPTPRSAVADNDAGMGMIVDALSRSPFWPHMAIFITEDDPQGGEDHVATHRTVDYVISPYVKHGYVSHVHHSSMSMTKTMELLLGVKPMSEYDRYATDMRDYFTATPDLTPYAALPRTFPPEVNPSATSARNRYLRQAAEMSEGIDWGQVDQAGWKLAEILRLIHIGEAAPSDVSPWGAGWIVAGLIVVLGLTSLAWRRGLFLHLRPAAPNSGE